MLIRCIHDPERADRLSALIPQLTGIQHELWPAVFAADFPTGCAAAHKAVVRYLQETRQPHGCIAEDDLLWCGGPGAWQHFLAGMQALPPDWEIYLAGISSGRVDPQNLGTVRRVTRYTGHHLYIVRDRLYERILGCPAGQHLDVWLGRQDTKAYCCWPLAAIQAPGYSANRKRVVDYTRAFGNFALWRG